MLFGNSSSGDRVEALQQRVANAEHAVVDERKRTQLFAMKWHEAMRTVTQLNNACRRKNRQIERLKERLLAFSPVNRENTTKI